MNMTSKERKEFNKCIKLMLKLCDDMDKMLDNMECQPCTTQNGPKVFITKEHYA
jgi:hypothetical protein